MATDAADQGSNNDVTADEVSWGDAPDASVEAAVLAAEGIVATVDGDAQALADAIKTELLPVLHRLSVTDTEVAIRAVAKLLPLGIGALRQEVREFRRALAHVTTAPPAGGGGKPSQADQIFKLAQEHFELARGADGAPYAIPRSGPRIARPLRGSGSLRAELAAAYAEASGKVSSSTAVASALLAVEGQALREPPTRVHLRFARDATGIWIDLGRQDGAAVYVTAAGWAVIDNGAPVVFRRSPLTGEMPIPETDGDVNRLREIIGVLEDDAWHLIEGWMVGAMLPDIPRPVLFMAAEAGSAKTTTAKMLVQTIDPSPSPTAKAPRDEKDWVVSASGSAVVALDNVGYVPAWLSDGLCRAVTGEGYPRRRLYSDGDIVVTTYRRAIIITGIDVSADRGDLLDRCVPVELRRIPDGQRREERVVLAEFEAARPAILGGLLDLLSAVLGALPDVELDTLPRMADYARVLAALDAATGRATLPAYLEATHKALAAGATNDLVAAAVSDLLDAEGFWEGIATDLLKKLDDRREGKPPKRWPSTPQHLAQRLRLAAPSLRAAGYSIDDDRLDPKRKTPIWTLGETDGRAMAETPDEDHESSDGSDGSDENPTPFSAIGNEEKNGWEHRL